MGFGYKDYENKKLKKLVQGSKIDTQKSLLIDKRVIKILEDLDYIPIIEKTKDNTHISFSKEDYKEDLYYKSELLSFIYASINKDFDVILGIDKKLGHLHYYLKNGEIIYDASLSLITTEDKYKKMVHPIKVISNANIDTYLLLHNHLAKFYDVDCKKFSSNYIKILKRKFDLKLEEKYKITEENISFIRDSFKDGDIFPLREFLTHKRKYEILDKDIITHPSIDSSIKEDIKSKNEVVTKFAKEIGIPINYYEDTIGNCYSLSILFSLFHEDYQLAQGYIPYIEESKKIYYQHSWLEKEDLVYDPALRLVTKKSLYDIFALKKDTYTKEEVEDVLRKIGFTLTHFSDYLNNIQVGEDNSFSSKFKRHCMGSNALKEEAESIFTLIKQKRP